MFAYWQKISISNLLQNKMTISSKSKQKFSLLICQYVENLSGIVWIKTEIALNFFIQSRLNFCFFKSPTLKVYAPLSSWVSNGRANWFLDISSSKFVQWIKALFRILSSIPPPLGVGDNLLHQERQSRLLSGRGYPEPAR